RYRSPPTARSGTSPATPPIPIFSWLAASTARSSAALMPAIPGASLPGNSARCTPSPGCRIDAFFPLSRREREPKSPHDMSVSEGRYTMTSPGEELLISADSHVIEDPHFWEQRLPAAFADQAPVFPEREVGGLFQAHPGGWDPHERVKEMAVDGVSGEVLYP